MSVICNSVILKSNLGKGLLRPSFNAGQWHIFEACRIHCFMFLGTNISLLYLLVIPLLSVDLFYGIDGSYVPAFYLKRP